MRSATRPIIFALLIFAGCGSKHAGSIGSTGMPSVDAGDGGPRPPSGGDGAASPDAAGGTDGSGPAGSGGRVDGATGGSSGGAGGAPTAGSSGRDAGGASGGLGGGRGPTGGAAGATNEACPIGGTLPSSSWSVRFANAVMSRWPDPAGISPTTGWEYNHGIVLRGIQQAWTHTCDDRYVAYIKKYADEFVDSAGTLTIPAAHSFDNIQPSVLLPFLYQRTGLAKYRAAADQVRARYDSIPTNPDGGFWHKQQYPNQMWLDGIYMGEPFLAQYGAVFGTCATFCADTISKQTLLIAAHVRDPATGLLYHAWDDSPAGQKAAWADPTTGRSPVIWDRAMGWYAMALVDTLPALPSGASRDSFLSLLGSLAAGLKATQDPATGLWFEVIDQAARSDDWVETSGSGMFVYALKVAVDRGYVDSTYLTVAQRGWQGLQAKITTDASGLPTITGAVQGVSVNGTYGAYINQKTLSNSSHGLCGILLAASEMEAR